MLLYTGWCLDGSCNAAVLRLLVGYTYGRESLKTARQPACSSITHNAHCIQNERSLGRARRPGTCGQRSGRLRAGGCAVRSGRPTGLRAICVLGRSAAATDSRRRRAAACKVPTLRLQGTRPSRIKPSKSCSFLWWGCPDQSKASGALGGAGGSGCQSWQGDPWTGRGPYPVAGSSKAAPSAALQRARLGVTI